MIPPTYNVLRTDRRTDTAWQQRHCDVVIIDKNAADATQIAWNWLLILAHSDQRCDVFHPHAIFQQPDWSELYFLATYESLYILVLKFLIVLIRKLIIFTISISISIKSVCSFFTSMANHWNIRRRVVQHADKIEDSKEVLKTFYVEITTAVKLISTS